MHNNPAINEIPPQYYYYSTLEQREKGLEALRNCLIRDGYIKISEEIEFTEILNQNNNETKQEIKG